MSFKRDLSRHPLGSTWLKFQGRKRPDGSSSKYLVRDLLPQDKDFVLTIMINYFLTEEPICDAAGILKDRESVELFRQEWRDVMEEGAALVCVTDDQEQRIAGFNMTRVCQKNGKGHEKTNAKPFNVIVDMVVSLKQDGAVFDKLNVDTYLGAFGLYILPEFRGEGVATGILRAREPLCKALGLTGTATVFSSIGAQKAAKGANFRELATHTPEQMEKAQGLKLKDNFVVMGRNI